MSEGPGSTSEAEEGLELARWGTRFTSADTEGRYRAWHVEQAVPFNRVGLFLSAALWLGVIAVWVSLGVFLSWVPVIALVVLPVIAWASFTTYRRSLLRWSLPSAMVANSVAGVVCVGLVTSPRAPIEAALGIVLIVNYFGFAILRARPAQAALAVAPYVGLTSLVTVRWMQAGIIDDTNFVIDTNVLANGFVSGLLISVVIDVVSRRSYRQERIIEFQKQTIARERARSEALLKNELGHQVAERSRELGDALARVAAPVSLPLPAPGDRFHTRYRVVRALGQGGMGAVFEVERITDAQHLALKLVTGQVSGAAAARFAREAEIGARVRHANLISIVDVGIAEGGAPFLVMELVRGGSLEERRARFGEIAWGLPIVKQIALGLSALHEAGVIHRDLKPANVLLDGGEASPVAKISDFGVSRFGQLDDVVQTDPDGPTLEASTPRRQDLTGTGVLLGTPLYMAPEALRGGRSLDAAADVFAFGLVAYEVLTGRAPFETPAVLVARAGRALPTPAPIEDASVGVVAREAIVACLSEEPGRRPGARRVCEALGAG